MEVRACVAPQMSTPAHLRLHSAQAHATWAVSLVVHSESSGLRVSVQQTPIQIKIDNVEGDTELPLAIKPDELLAEALPKTIDLEAAVALFVHFEKAWLSCYPGMSAYKLAHPVFNRRGDLLFELRPQSSAGSIVANGDSTSGPRIVAKAGAGRNFGINRRRGRANGRYSIALSAISRLRALANRCY